MSVYVEGIIPFDTDNYCNPITAITTDDSGRYYTVSPDTPLGFYGLDEY